MPGYIVTYNVEYNPNVLLDNFNISHEEVILNLILHIIVTLLTTYRARISWSLFSL